MMTEEIEDEYPSRIDLGHELADVLNVLVAIAGRRGIDLGASVVRRRRELEP